MSLVSSLRLSSLPSLSRHLVQCVSVPSISASHRNFSTLNCSAQNSSLLSSSSNFSNAISARSFSANSLVAPGSNRLVLSKNEALDQLESEIRELTLPEDAEIETYIASNQFKVDAGDREVRLTRSDDKATIEVRFALMPDTDDMAGMPNQEQLQQQQEQKNESNEEQPPKPLKHSFMVQIHTKAAKNNFLHANCHADEEGRIVIEHIATDEEACKRIFNPDEKDQQAALEMSLLDANTSKFLNFEDLPDGPAEKVFNLLCDFGIDDRLALFVQQYSYIIRTKQQVERVKGLADFINSIP